MQLHIAHSHRPLMFALLVVLAVVAIGLPGDFQWLSRVCDVSPEFVGNLTGTFHDISLDRLVPTYPPLLLSTL